MVFRFVVDVGKGSVRGASWLVAGKPAMWPAGNRTGTGLDCCGIATPAPGT